MTSWGSTLSIDIETYSSVDLGKSGMYRYVEAPDFEILLVACAFDDEHVWLIDPDKEVDQLYNRLSNPRIRKAAYNAAFEIACLSKHFGLQLPAAQWDCTMNRALMLGFPGKLGDVAKVLGAEEKDTAGTALINYFSKPCRPTVANGGRTRNLPGDNPEKWEAFKRYCIQDVETERSVRQKLEQLGDVPSQERKVWLLDQEINRRGIRVDTEFVDAAIDCAEAENEALKARAQEITGLDNPNSVAQLKGWLGPYGLALPDLTKATVASVAKDAATPSEVAELLSIRAQAGKTSTAKYEAMRAAVCADGRIRGLLQYYGANRTGRWAGRLVQIHNLPQNHLPDLDDARRLVKDRKFSELSFMYPGALPVLSELVRTAFVPTKGNVFIVADFSAIEARIIAWLAHERWRNEVFAGDGKIYEASAAKMFHVPIETIDKQSPLRQKGKIAELALGYGGSVEALKQMGGEAMGLTEREMQELVRAWRWSNPAIVQLWRGIGDAALCCAKDGGKNILTMPANRTKISFEVRRGILHIGLPSGRDLCYVQPRVEAGKFGGDALVYMGVNQTTRKWKRTETYGPKLVENIVQAIARDCLAAAMLRLDDEGLTVVAHVHDEVIIEAEDAAAAETAERIMGDPIPWAPGLLLTADSFTTEYYKKE